MSCDGTPAPRRAPPRRRDRRAHDSPRHRPRRPGDRLADPRARRVRAAARPGGGHAGAHPAARLRRAPVFRDADLPPREGARRLRALLLHVLDVPRAPEPLPGGSLRRAGGARARGGKGCCSARWRRSPWRAGAGGWSGRCSTGTARRSRSTSASAPASARSGSLTRPHRLARA